MFFEEGLIEFLQSYRSSALDIFFLVVSILGTQYFFLSASAVIYWSYDRKFGMKLAILMLVSFWATLLFKELFHMPRPNDKYRIEYPYFEEKYTETYGFPSGHALNSVIFWYAFASWTKNKFVYLLGILITVLVSISRIYLGFHFLSDVLGGLLFGCIFAVVYSYFTERLEQFCKVDKDGNMFDNRLKICLIILFTLLFLFPFSLDSAKIAGGFLGYTLGYQLLDVLSLSKILDNISDNNSKNNAKNPKHSKKEKITRSILGLGMLAIFFVPLSLAIYFFNLNRYSTFISFISYFLLYLLMGLLITLIVPILLDNLLNKNKNLS